MLRSVASLLVPPACSLCDVPVAASERVCHACRRELARLGPVRSDIAGLPVVSAARYEGAARRLVARLKFSSRLGLVEVAAEAMADAWGAAAGVLVPVPAAAGRERVRGFDGAWLLASAIGARTGARAAGCLTRRDGRRQFGRPRGERIADPPRIAVARASPAAWEEPVWIVDDVATTGATLLACRRALHEAGAVDVRALTFARAR